MTCCISPLAELSGHELSAAPAGVRQSIAAISGRARHSDRHENNACLDILLLTIPPPFQSRTLTVGRRFLASALKAPTPARIEGIRLYRDYASENLARTHVFLMTSV